MGLDFSIPHRIFSENFWNCVRKEDGAILSVSKNIGHRLFVGMRVHTDAKQTPIEAEKFVGVRLDVDLVEGHESVVGKSVALHTDRNSAQALDEAWEKGMSELQTSTKTYEEVRLQLFHRAFWSSLILRSTMKIHRESVVFSRCSRRFAVRSMAQHRCEGFDRMYNGNAFWTPRRTACQFYLFSNPTAAS
jgi:hypothetical protein